MNLINKAIFEAEHWHRGQVRKYTGEPYVNHPIAVGIRLARRGFGEYVIAAGILRDVLEDTSCTEEFMRSKFGPSVTDLVLEVTDVAKPEDGNRATRVALNRQHLAGASHDGQSIKLADILENTADILANDPDFAHVYMSEKRALLDVLTDGDTHLYWEAKNFVERYYADKR